MEVDFIRYDIKTKPDRKKQEEFLNIIRKVMNIPLGMFCVTDIKMLVQDKSYVVVENHSHSKIGQSFQAGDIIRLKTNHVLTRNGKQLKKPLDGRSMKMFHAMTLKEYKHANHKMVSKAYEWGAKTFGDEVPSKSDIAQSMLETGLDAFKTVARLVNIQRRSKK